MEDKDVLLSAIKAEFERLGTTRYAVFNKNKSSHLPCAVTIRKRLGMNWNEIVMACGYDVTYHRWNKDKIAKLINDVYAKYQDVTMSLIEKHGLKDTVLLDYFISLKDACDYAGVEYKRQKRIETPETNEELLQMYIKFSNKLGRAARVRDLDNSPTIYNFEVFRSRFGSLEELQKQAGYQPKKHHKSISKEYCLNVMLNIYKEYGKIPYDKLKEMLPFAIRTLLRKFSTTKIDDVWNEVIKHSTRNSSNHSRNSGLF